MHAIDFCVDASTTQINCKPVQFFEYPDSSEIINKLRMYFKTYLPPYMYQRKKDCDGHCIKLDPRAIDITYPENFPDYWAIIVPKDDLSTYHGDAFETENSEYTFELELMAKSKTFLGVIWNLNQLQSAVKSLLTSLEQNLGMSITIDNYTVTDETKEENVYIKTGIYKFSVLGLSTDSQLITITI